MLIDHQPYQVASVKNVDPALMINNAVALAKSARAFEVPTLLTSVLAERGGAIFRQLTDVFPDQTPIDRTFINTWEDQQCVEWVKRTGRKKIVIAALWTEICLAFPVIQALGEGYDVFFVTDASGGTAPRRTRWVYSG
jgi:nicotinamidase-related amidase